MVLEQAFSRTTLSQVGIFESNSESRASGFLLFVSAAMVSALSSRVPMGTMMVSSVNPFWKGRSATRRIHSNFTIPGCASGGEACVSAERMASNNPSSA
jgi:hypothetical protein